MVVMHHDHHDDDDDGGLFSFTIPDATTSLCHSSSSSSSNSNSKPLSHGVAYHRDHEFSFSSSTTDRHVAGRRASCTDSAVAHLHSRRISHADELFENGKIRPLCPFAAAAAIGHYEPAGPSPLPHCRHPERRRPASYNKFVSVSMFEEPPLSEPILVHYYHHDGSPLLDKLSTGSCFNYPHYYSDKANHFHHLKSPSPSPSPSPAELLPNHHHSSNSSPSSTYNEFSLLYSSSTSNHEYSPPLDSSLPISNNDAVIDADIKTTHHYVHTEHRSFVLVSSSCHGGSISQHPSSHHKYDLMDMQRTSPPLVSVHRSMAREMSTAADVVHYAVCAGTSERVISTELPIRSPSLKVRELMGLQGSTTTASAPLGLLKLPMHCKIGEHGGKPRAHRVAPSTSATNCSDPREFHKIKHLKDHKGSSSPSHHRSARQSQYRSRSLHRRILSYLVCYYQEPRTHPSL